MMAGIAAALWLLWLFSYSEKFKSNNLYLYPKDWDFNQNNPNHPIANVTAVAIN
jgi:hypothetical protein